MKIDGGANCHVGYRSCFYQSIPAGPIHVEPVVLLRRFIDRRLLPDPHENVDTDGFVAFRRRRQIGDADLFGRRVHQPVFVPGTDVIELRIGIGGRAGDRHLGQKPCLAGIIQYPVDAADGAMND